MTKVLSLPSLLMSLRKKFAVVYQDSQVTKRVLTGVFNGVN